MLTAGSVKSPPPRLLALSGRLVDLRQRAASELAGLKLRTALKMPAAGTCPPERSRAFADLRFALRGWAYRIRTGESVRALSEWKSVTTWPEVGASPTVECVRARAA